MAKPVSVKPMIPRPDAATAAEKKRFAPKCIIMNTAERARRELGLLPAFFDVERYRVISERRRNARGELVVESEAVVTVALADGTKTTSYYKNENAHDLRDAGPVNALAQALKKDLGPYQGMIDDMKLVDFKVRITNGGTEAVTRVIIDSEDSAGRRWQTVGVSANIVDASFEALLDAINWKLVRDMKVPA
jgi:2-isopropylmalate synthase